MKKFLAFTLVATLTVAVPAATYFVAPSGNDSNSGDEASPFYNISKATALAMPGDIIWVRGGTFIYTNTIKLTNSGAPGAPIKLWAYTNELPFLDFSGMADNGTNRGFLLTSNANWWHFRGLEIYRAGDNAIKVESSHNIFEQLSMHHNRDTGLQIGLGDSDADIPNRVASNLVVNCDSYLNYDPRASGGNADGFACKLHPGRGNIFRGCRSWENSDDGWDLYKNEFDVTLEDCWTWHNGDPASFGVSKAGNAGGFKLGGDSGFSGERMVIRCIAFDNYFGGSGAGKAFHQNDHQGTITLFNCLSFSNNYNYALNNSGGIHIVKNCISFDAYGNDHKLVSSNTGPDEIYVSNSFNLPVTVNSADFTALSEAAPKVPRQADGSLPTTFAHLVAGSDLIDKGVNVGLPYNGTAPDLGPFEFTVIQQLVSIGSSVWTNGEFSLRIDGLTSHGQVVVHTSSNLANWNPIFTNPPVTGSLQFTDTVAPALLQRYYRAEEK